MNQTHGQGPQNLVDPETAELPVEPRDRRLIIAVLMVLRSVEGPVVMDVIAVAVQMRVKRPVSACPSIGAL